MRRKKYGEKLEPILVSLPRSVKLNLDQTIKRMKDCNMKGRGFSRQEAVIEAVKSWTLKKQNQILEAQNDEPC